MARISRLDLLDGYDLALVVLSSTNDPVIARRAWAALRSANPEGPLFAVELGHHGDDTNTYYFRLQVLSCMDAGLTNHAMMIPLKRSWRTIDAARKWWLGRKEADRARARIEFAMLVKRGSLEALYLRANAQRALLRENSVDAK